MNPLAPYNFIEQVAVRVLDILVTRRAMLHPAGTVFYVWQRGNRIIVAFDPNAIDLKRVNEDFAHELSTRLRGRLVVRTNSRGLFLQVGFDTPAAPMSLDAKPLDLVQQPSPWHMPIGITKDGPLWISLIDGDSFLVGGSRRKGKSGLTHGMIQALLHGSRTQVYAWDGKGGAEYQGYIGRPNFHFIGNAESGLKSLRELLDKRLEQLRASGYVNIFLHNKAGLDFIQPIALFVDEIAMLDDRLKDALKRMVEFYGAAGLYSVLATNSPTQASILVKTNLSTRICFAVPSFNDSLTVLGMKGAEALTERGRGLIIWDGLTEFQSFEVAYPEPTEEQRRLLADQLSSTQRGGSNEQPSVVVDDPDLPRILDLIKLGETDAAIVRAIWGVSGGSKFYKLVERVKALRPAENTSSSTSSSENKPFSPNLDAVAG